MKPGESCTYTRCKGTLVLLPRRERDATVAAYNLGGWEAVDALPWARAYGRTSKYLLPAQRRK